MNVERPGSCIGLEKISSFIKFMSTKYAVVEGSTALTAKVAVSIAIQKKNLK